MCRTRTPPAPDAVIEVHAKHRQDKVLLVAARTACVPARAASHRTLEQSSHVIHPICGNIVPQTPRAPDTEIEVRAKHRQDKTLLVAAGTPCVPARAASHRTLEQGGHVIHPICWYTHKRFCHDELAVKALATEE